MYRYLKLEIVDRQCLSRGKLSDELQMLTEYKLFTNWRSTFLPKWMYITLLYVISKGGGACLLFFQ